MAAALELVTIGNELLLGETVDGNAAWLGRRLATAGIRVARRATVGDDPAAIRDAVEESLRRTGAVLCTGGLGPTRDDMTKAAVAALFGRELILDEAVLEGVRLRFQERGRQMPESSRNQAEVPAGAIIFPNPRGTASGLALEDDEGRFAILLPGVPREMHALVEGDVLPWLQRRWPARDRPILHRVLRTTGIPESELAERIDDLVAHLEPLTIAFLPGTVGGVDLRLTSWGTRSEAEATRAFDAAEASIRERLGGSVYGRDGEGLHDSVARALTGRGLTLALAESCTGGLTAKRLTDRAGASAYLLGAIVAYANDAKSNLLGVGTDTLAEHGAVSEASAREMALGARRAFGADVALSITGIAGPGGGTPDKPVGTVLVAASIGECMETRTLRLAGDRAEIREWAAEAGLALLWKMLGQQT